MKKIPYFSIYIPVKNRPELLKETLNAIAEQSFENFECVIGDDGSTDNTYDVITNFVNKDKRFIPVRNVISIGDSLTSNNLLTRLNGTLAARMDSDDLPKKDWLLHSYDFAQNFMKNGGIAFGSQIEIFGNNIDIQFHKNKETNPLRWNIWSLFNYELAHSGLIFDRKLQLENNIYYKNESKNSDWDFVNQLSYYGKIANLEYHDIKVRRHGNNVSLSNLISEDLTSLSVKLRAESLLKKLGIQATEEEMILHCTCQPAPYWNFNEQLYVWENRESYIQKLNNWLTKIIIANNEKKYFNNEMLQSILFNEILYKVIIKINELEKPKEFKLLWLPSN